MYSLTRWDWPTLPRINPQPGSWIQGLDGGMNIVEFRCPECGSWILVRGRIDADGRVARKQTCRDCHWSDAVQLKDWWK
jgi:predicted RNA-binding Zn-ribbon protein involved in translation (DUF1610 family)